MISRVMWLIKGKHRRLKAEVLSEYLDGRLEGAALARVERSLAECSACREDLDSLQATVAALRRLPVEVPARDFVMAAPPFRPERRRPTPLARASMWAYAGAASVAALVLTVLASADATGLLAPSQQGFDESSTAAFDAPVSATAPVSDAALEQDEAPVDLMAMADEESAATIAPAIAAEPTAEMALAEAADDSMAMADEESAASEPLATAEPMAAAEPSAAFDDSGAMADGDVAEGTLETAGDMAAMDDAGVFDDSEAMAYEDAAGADAMDADDAVAAMEPETVVDAGDAMPSDAPADDTIPASPTPEELEPALQPTSEAVTEAPAPTAAVQVAAAAGDTMAAAEDAPAPTGPPSEPAPADEDAPDEERRATPSPQPAVAAPAQESVETQSTVTVVEEEQTLQEPAPDLDPEPQGPGTALYWRILQGIAGALALLFLAAFVVKWRASRSNGVARS